MKAFELTIKRRILSVITLYIIMSIPVWMMYPERSLNPTLLVRLWNHLYNSRYDILDRITNNVDIFDIYISRLALYVSAIGVIISIDRLLGDHKSFSLSKFGLETIV